MLLLIPHFERSKHSSNLLRLNSIICFTTEGTFSLFIHNFVWLHIQHKTKFTVFARVMMFINRAIQHCKFYGYTIKYSFRFEFLYEVVVNYTNTFNDYESYMINNSFHLSFILYDLSKILKQWTCNMNLTLVVIRWERPNPIAVESFHYDKTQSTCYVFVHKRREKHMFCALMHIT